MPDRVVFAPGSEEAEVHVFDTALTPVASWSGWGSGDGPLAIVGDRLVGLDWATIEVARVAGGPVTEWADLESGVPGAIVPFPGGAPIETAEPEPTSTTTTKRHGESSEAAGPGGGGRSGTAGPRFSSEAPELWSWLSGLWPWCAATGAVSPSCRDLDPP